MPRALKNRGCRIHLLLAMLLALRALVPVGYMLSLPSDESFALALHLCPTQNPTLDLAQFSAVGETGNAHHGHTGNSSHGTDAGMAVAVSPDCNAWLGSTVLAVTTHPPTFDLDHAPVLPPHELNALAARITRSYAALPRAPPGLPA